MVTNFLGRRLEQTVTLPPRTSIDRPETSGGRGRDGDGVPSYTRFISRGLGTGTARERSPVRQGPISFTGLTGREDGPPTPTVLPRLGHGPGRPSRLWTGAWVSPLGERCEWTLHRGLVCLSGLFIGPGGGGRPENGLVRSVGFLRFRS